jgi:dTMP kinase
MGVSVISDRYDLSSYAYQSEVADLDWLRLINSKCVRPDLTVFIDVPVEICQRRMQRERWEVHVFEEASQLERVRERYLTAIDILQRDGEPIVTVDGTAPVQAVHRTILRATKDLWNEKSRMQAHRSQLAFQE